LEVLIAVITAGEVAMDEGGGKGQKGEK